MQDTDTPLLSIIMPFYNNKELVAEMIDSILANCFKNWELLAIDDGSSKETIEYLDKYKQDKRIRIIKRNISPKGAQTCRNIGIEKMRGEFTVFFDSDDYITPDCLQTRIDIIKKHTDLDFVVFPSGTYIEHSFYPNAPKFKYGYGIHKNDITAFARRELPFIVWNNIYRSDSIKAYQMKWDTNLLSLQDADFNITAITRGMKYKYANVRPDYGYRIEYSQESVSKKILSEEHFNSHIYATKKFFKLLQPIYGHKYDYAIFQGLLSIYNRAFTNGINKATALNMVKCIYQYNHIIGCMFKLQVKLTIFLEKFISARKARQIIMAPYLIMHIRREKVIQNKIKSII